MRERALQFNADSDDSDNQHEQVILINLRVFFFIGVMIYHHYEEELSLKVFSPILPRLSLRLQIHEVLCGVRFQLLW